MKSSASPEADKKAFPLPEGSHATPLRIDSIPEGTYTVVFKSPDGATQSSTCDLVADHMCSAAFTPIGDSQIDEILAGQK